MRRRDRFLELLGSSRGQSTAPQARTVPNAQAATTIGQPTQSPLNTAGTPTTAGSGNRALELAIVRHLYNLPEVKRQAFHEASKNSTDKNVLDHVKACDANHLANSHHRLQAEALSRFLGLLD
jgi:hypothetical protein